MTDQFPRVKGRCPACESDSLFLAAEGYITCSRVDCPNPVAADNLLHLHGLPTPIRLPLTAVYVDAIALRDTLAQVKQGERVWPKGTQ